MAFELTGGSNSVLTSDLGGSVSTGAMAVLFACKQMSDLNAVGALCEFQDSPLTNLHLLGTTGNGTAVTLYANYGGVTDPAEPVDFASEIENWIWWFIRGSGNTLQIWYKPDDIEASWTALNASPVTANALAVATMFLGNNDRGEGLNARFAGIRAWGATKDVVDMDDEIQSPEAVDTNSLVLDKLGQGEDLTAALAAGVGSLVMGAGTVTLEEDLPSTIVFDDPGGGDPGGGDPVSRIWLPRMSGGILTLNGWLA